ncbi:MAG: hypothetical protein Q4C66_06290 [Lachnospiraceae bacterium]|nr:hypothetical protein [Lachnospiraceae bacterium]
MGKTKLGNFFAVSVIVGTIAALTKLLEYLNEQESKYCLAEFKDLLENQKTVDVLNAREITDWIKNIKSENDGKLTYILAYPTTEILKKYRLKGFPENIDKKHTMIFFAVYEQTGSPVKVQLISFGTIDSTIEAQLFNGEDYAVVEE